MASDKTAEMPDREQLMKVIETSQAAQRAQSMASDLKSRAGQITDNSQREKMLKEAFDKEVEANGLSKTAKRLQSGTWQGLGFGGGIGAATGLGLGAGLGTLIGAITAVPAAGLGMLVGSGVGAIHGPWIKLGGKEQKFEDADPSEIVDAIQKGQDTQQAAEEVQGQNSTKVDAKQDNSTQPQPAKRKPKKLEIRSQNKPPIEQKSTFGTANGKPKTKPRKLEIRSGKTSSS